MRWDKNLSSAGPACAVVRLLVSISLKVGQGAPQAISRIVF
jgi:hypothetical protein